MAIGPASGTPNPEDQQGHQRGAQPAGAQQPILGQNDYIK
jgi:hypothetical protein